MQRCLFALHKLRGARAVQSPETADSHDSFMSLMWLPWQGILRKDPRSAPSPEGHQLSCLMGGFSSDPLKGGPKKGLRERQLMGKRGTHFDNSLSLYYCVGNYCGSSGGISGLWSLMTFIVENIVWTEMSWVLIQSKSSMKSEVW